MVQCSKCGTMNDDKSKFCSNCGNSLNTSNMFDFQLEKSQQQNNEPRGQNDPRRIDENQHVNAQQQKYEQRGQNDPRRIDERYHVSNQQQTSEQWDNNDSSRINQQNTYTQSQAYQQQGSSNQNYNNKSNDSIMDKISNLSTPVKIIGLVVCCCIGILVVGSLMGGVSDQGSLPSSSSNDNSYGGIFDSFSKADCKEINYKELNKNPDKYTGENIKLYGTVMQISEGNSEGNYLLMYVNGNYNQLAYVEYYNDTNIVEDDYITVYGVCGGSYSYTTKIGGTNTVPSVYGAILESS